MSDDTTEFHGAGTCEFDTCSECQSEASCPECGEIAPIVTVMNALRECQNTECPDYGWEFM